MKKLIFLAVVASALFSSCQKNNNLSPNAKNIPGGISAKNRPVLTTDVYVAGDNAVAPFNAATYWKNGVSTALSGSGTGSTHAQAIAVSGTDVYVVGYDNGTPFVFGSPNSGLPCIWKNGVEQLLPIPTGHTGGAHAVAISGSDVYVAGYYITNDAVHSRRAMLWKNGVAKLMAFNTFDSIATGVAVDGADVYVCGNAVFNGITCAVYWKNNIWHPFAGTTVTSRAASIAVDQRHNYYINGSSNGKGCYWKNANLFALANDVYIPTNSTNDIFYGNTLSLDNGNVYVSGETVIFGDDHAMAQIAYWKNGQIFINSQASGDQLVSYGPQAISVINNTVCMSFMAANGNGPSTLNYGYTVDDNAFFLLNDSPSFIGGIAVVQH